MDEVTGNPALDAEITANPATETEHDDVDEILSLEDENDGEQDEAPKDEQPQPRKLKVKIDGQELEVDEDEAAKGYQRQADYSRNMQRLQQEAQQVNHMREMYQQRIEQFIPEQEAKLQRLQQELATLAIEDPAMWVQKQQEFQTEVQRYQQAHAEREQLNQEKARQDQEFSQKRLQQSEAALIDAIPEWKDTAKRQAEAPEVAKYLREKVGLTESDLAAVNSGAFGHFPVVMARKAMQYDALMAKVAARKGSKTDMTEAPAPVQTVKTKGSAGKDPSRMSTEEWMNWRNKQVQGRR